MDQWSGRYDQFASSSLIGTGADELFRPYICAWQLLHIRTYATTALFVGMLHPTAACLSRVVYDFTRPRESRPDIRRVVNPRIYYHSRYLDHQSGKKSVSLLKGTSQSCHAVSLEADRHCDRDDSGAIFEAVCSNNSASGSNPNSQTVKWPPFTVRYLVIRIQSYNVECYGAKTLWLRSVPQGCNLQAHDLHQPSSSFPQVACYS